MGRSLQEILWPCKRCIAQGRSWSSRFGCSMLWFSLESTWRAFLAGVRNVWMGAFVHLISFWYGIKICLDHLHGPRNQNVLLDCVLLIYLVSPKRSYFTTQHFHLFDGASFHIWIQKFSGHLLSSSWVW